MMDREAYNEQLPFSDQTPEGMNDPRVIDFLENRDIHPEDRVLIEQALQLPRDIYINNHNTIPFKEDALESYLKKQLELLATSKDTTAFKYTNIMFVLCQKYDWTTCWNLNSVMEKVAPRIEDIK